MARNKRTKYVVYSTTIMDDDGNKVGDGEVVALTDATAKHYNKLGYLRPYLGDEEGDDGESDGDDGESDDGDEGTGEPTVGEQTTEFTRRRRVSTKPES